MTGITIRKMKSVDLDAAMSILSQWNMAPVAASDEINNPERSELVVENSFVAEQGGRIVGVCSFIVHTDELAETASLAVDPVTRGTGAGYQLQVARMRDLKLRGIRTLHTETDRPDTINWYITKFGYRVVGKNPKKHAFSLDDVDEWTVLHVDLADWSEDP